MARPVMIGILSGFLVICLLCLFSGIAGSFLHGFVRGFTDGVRDGLATVTP